MEEKQSDVKKSPNPTINDSIVLYNNPHISKQTIISLTDKSQAEAVKSISPSLGDYITINFPGSGQTQYVFTAPKDALKDFKQSIEYIQGKIKKEEKEEKTDLHSISDYNHLIPLFNFIQNFNTKKISDNFFLGKLYSGEHPIPPHFYYVSNDKEQLEEFLKEKTPSDIILLRDFLSDIGITREERWKTTFEEVARGEIAISTVAASISQIFGASVDKFTALRGRMGYDTGTKQIVLHYNSDVAAKTAAAEFKKEIEEEKIELKTDLDDQNMPQRKNGQIILSIETFHKINSNPKLDEYLPAEDKRFTREDRNLFVAIVSQPLVQDNRLIVNTAKEAQASTHKPKF